MMTLNQFAAQLERAIATITPKLEVGLDKVGELGATLAASYPGHYQPGWPALAESTIADKAAKGYPVPSPLLRTGAMAESIKHELMPAELAVVVGSSDKTALFQEMGTTRIPPRPFLELGLRNALPFAAETFGKIAADILMGK